jgi:alkaline phosphatase
MKPSYRLLLAGLLAGSSLPAADNVILFIGDGMGQQQVRAGRAYVNGNTSLLLQFEGLGYTAEEVTLLPGGGITDSATAGTALATGYQHPSSGIISMGANNSIKTTILDLAKSKGKLTGIITTDDIGGATPGAFGAHDLDRNQMASIRADYLRYDTLYGHAASLPTLILGGGYNDPALVSGTSYSYVGLAESLGYGFVSTYSAMQGAGFPLLGLFGTSWAPMTGMLYRSGSSPQPTLSQMVTRSLNLLQNINGFFIIVEGANIDKFCHNNDKYFVGEVAELNAAVAEAVAWRQNHPEQNTLIFVTADHETGGVTVPDQTITPGSIPALSFGSTGHTGANVPAFATWPPSIQGQVLDNTETFYILQDYLNYSQGGQPPVVTGLTISGVTDSGAIVQWTTAELGTTVAELTDGVSTFTFQASGRIGGHSVACAGLAPGTTYQVTARSTDLGGFAGTGTAAFTTTGGDPNAYAIADPVVRTGTLSGTYQGVLNSGDGLKQTVTEAPDGVGSGILVEYTLHTSVPVANVDSLTIVGQVSWTLSDGQQDGLITEIRLLGPDGSFAWQPITLPFVAEPASAYLDASGNVVVRFQDGASIRRERKDVLSVDYLAGQVVKRGVAPVNPSIPMNLVATPGANSVGLTWDDSSYAAGYEIWRYTAAGGWVFLGNVNSASFTDTAVAPSSSYDYVVRSYNSDGYADSAPASVVTPTWLVAATGLKATGAKSAINLTWTDTNTGETGYQVLRGLAPESLSVVAALVSNTTSYSDKNLTRGTTYYYQVRAMVGTTPGPISATASATVK